MATYVYIVQQDCNGPIKIGKAVNIENRVKQMQSGNPYLIELVHYFTCLNDRDAFALESELHSLLDDFRMNAGGGTEWFKKQSLGRLRKYANAIYYHGKIKGKDISLDLKARLYEFNATHQKGVNHRFIKHKDGTSSRRVLDKRSILKTDIESLK